jgi:predicted enzyme related to lactoylglutathione lyase
VGSAVVHFEICAADDAPLVAFYGKLFGWELRGTSGGGYTTIDTRSGGGINGWIRKNPPGRPGTVFYVETDDLRVTLDRASALGGTTAMPVTGFGPAGSRAMVADPDGLLVGLVRVAAVPAGREEPTRSAGSGEPATWFEVMGSDPARTQQFYADLFGWTVDRSFPAYAAVDTGAGRGIMGGLGGGTQARWATVYAKVGDVAQVLSRASELGGSPVTDPSVPALKSEARAALYGSAGTMKTGAFRDPAGNIFGVFDYGTR